MAYDELLFVRVHTRGWHILLVLLIILLILSLPIAVQAIPGGIQENLTLWLNAKNHSTLFQDTCDGTASTTNLDRVGCWQDTSGNGRNFTISGNLRPTLRTDSQAINFNPALRFDGSEDYLSDETGESYINGLTEFSTFVVVHSDVISADNYIFNAESDASGAEAPWGLRFDASGALSSRTNTLKTGIDTGTEELYEGDEDYITNANPLLLSLHWRTGKAPQIHVDGKNISIHPTTTSTGVLSNADYVRIGHQAGHSYWDGNVAELIHYDMNLNTTAKQQVESYLAIKYGITLNNTDYMSSTKTLLWDVSSHSSYSNLIAGIANDTGSGLYQNKSRSTHPDAIITIAAENQIEHAKALLWGNNNGTNAWTVTDAPSGYRLLTRSWQTQKTGDLGNLTLSLNVENTNYDVPALLYGSSYYFIYDADSDGSLNDETPIELHDDGTNGDENSSDNVWTKNFIDLANNTIFSFATQITPFPGGVNNVQLWLKADKGVTPTTGTVTSWQDQTGTNTIVAFGDPQTNQSQTNFNNMINFDGDDDYFDGGTSITMREVFLVADADNNAPLLTSNASYPGSTKEYWLRAISGQAYIGDSDPDYIYANTPIPGGVIIYNNEMTGGSQGTDSRIVFNGENQSVTSISGNDPLESFSSSPRIGKSPDLGFTTEFDGLVGEIVVYNESLSHAQRTRVNTYLAIKYGITLHSSLNYLDSAENTIFASTGSHENYTTDVAGLGRDDGSLLNQTRSKSINEGSLLEISNATTLGNTEFLVWGNDGGTLNTTSTDTPKGKDILDRVWRVDQTGDVGTVDIIMNISLMNLSSTAQSDLFLITNESGSNFSLVMATVADSKDSDLVTFLNVDFTSDDFFTLAVTDTIYPVISYIAPTQSNGTVAQNDYIDVNVSVTENHLANLTYRMYNSTFALVNETTYQSVQSKNFTSLVEDTYYYNVTACDESDLCNSTETRVFILDSVPSVTQIYPSGQTFNTSTTIAINATVIDTTVDTVLANITYANGTVEQLIFAHIAGNLYSTNFTTPAFAGDYNVTIIANDSYGNVNNTERTQFLVNLGNPNDISAILAWYDGADNTTLFTDSFCSSQVTTDNQEVLCWQNKAGGTNATVVPGKSGARYRSIASERISSSTTLRFNKSNETVYQTGVDIRADTTEDITLFAVYRPRTNVTTDQGQGLWGNDNGAWDRFYYSLFQESGGLGTDGIDDGLVSLGGASSGLVIDGAGVVDTVFLLTTIYDGNVSGGTNSGPENGSQIYFDGILQREFTDESHATAAETQMYMGWDGDNGHYDGDLAEVIIYDRILSFCQIQLVNNYLGAKYGKDFSGVGASYGHGAPHNNDVVGITEYTGNCSVNTEITSASSSIVTISNPSSLDSNDSLTFGHDDGGFSLIAQAPENYTTRLSQSWRVDKDNEPGNVSVSFDLSSTGISVEDTNFALLLDSDTVFNDSTVHTQGISVSANVVTFTNVNFTHADYFTLALEEPIPSIFFISPTSENNAHRSVNYFPVNVSSNVSREHYTFVNLNDSFVLWMRMDDVDLAGNPIGISGNGNNGTLVGNTHINGTGKFGKAAHFDGAGDYINLQSSNVVMSDKNSWTMAAWFHPLSIDSGSLGNRIITIRSSSTNSEVALALGDSNQIQFFYRDSGGSGHTEDIRTISTNEWYHYVATYDGTTYTIYINGEQNATIVDSINDPSSDVARIGTNPSASTEFFHGAIDEFLILNRSFFPDEVRSLYNATNNQYDNNFSNVIDNTYTFQGHAVSVSGQRNQTEVRTVTIDTLSPAIAYTTGTPPNNAILNAQSILVNVSVTELHEANITFTLRNSSFDIINTSFFSSATREINFSSLDEGTYHFSVTVRDLGDLSSTTSSREVTLDTSPPAVFSLTPQDSMHIITSVIEVGANVTDDANISTVLANITYPNGTTEEITLNHSTGDTYNVSYLLPALEGVYSITFFANDSVGNINHTEVTNFTTRNYSTPSIFFNIPPTPMGYVANNNLTLSLNSSDVDADLHYSFLDHNSSLVFWMRMDDRDGSGNPLDISGYGNNGTVIGSPIFNSTGAYGDGLHLDGIQDFINVSDHPSLRLGSGDLTIAAWFNLRSYSDEDQQIVVKRASGEGDYEIQVEDTRRIVVYLGEGGGPFTNLNSSFNVSLNTWYHTVMVNRNGTFSLYVNGILEDSVSFSGNVDSSAPLQIGNDPAKPTEFFNGSIDEVLIFNRSFTVNEVLALYNATVNQYLNNFSNLTDGNHSFTAHAVSSFGARNQTDLNFFVDITSPEVTYGSQTLDDYTVAKQSFVYVDATVIESNEANITFRLFNSTQNLLNETIYTTAQRFINFTNLESGVYYYNITVLDLAGNSKTTSTRTITLDTTSPDILFIDPTPLSGIYRSRDDIYVNLSSNDTSEHYSFTSFDNGTLLWLRMENTLGEILLDESVFGRNGTLNGSSTSMNGRFGRGVHFDGIDDFVELPTNINVTNQAFSISAWVRANDLGSNQVYFGMHDSNSQQKSIHLRIQTDGLFRFGYYSNDLDTPSGTIQAETWYHIVTTYDGVRDLSTIYINGEENATGSQGPFTGNPSEVTIGSWRSGEYFNGTVDELLLFNRTLNSTEVLSLFNASSYQYGANFTSLQDGEHTVQGFAVDKSGNKNQTELRTITIDTTPPIISYNTGTPLNNTTLTAQSILVNVSVTEINEANITFTLRNSSFDIINTSFFSTPVREVNFSSLDEGTYHFSVTVRDLGDLSSTTSSREVSLYTSPPAVLFLNASPGTSYDLSEEISISVNVTAASGVDTVLANITLPNTSITQITLVSDAGDRFNNSFAVPGLVGIYTVRIIANDSQGNTNSSESTTFEIQNDVPSSSVVTINGGSAITLTSGSNTSITGSATITDLNGFGHIVNVTGYLFLTETGIKTTDNNSDHYTSMCTDNGDGSGSTISYNCTFNITHYATPTDTGANKSSTNWTFLILPKDSEDAGANDTDDVELNTLASFNISPSVIHFGSLNLSTNTTNINQQINVTNLGNVGLDTLLSGTNLSCSSGTVSVTQLEYEDTPFTYGSGTDLLESDVELDLDALPGDESNPQPVKTTYYGLGIPGIAVGGSCNGSLVITGASDPHND